MTTLTKGSDLNSMACRDVLGRFCHRFTADFTPEWARCNPNYKPQFADDSDWLANSKFYTRDDGMLDERYSHCISHPTWPQGKGVWGQKGKDW